MKLWYQSFARADGLGNYARALDKVLGEIADPGTEFVVKGIERSGGTNNYYRWTEHLDTGEVIENAIEAQRSGCDAMLIGNIADPGLREVRELLTIPVLGLCETALHLACIMGGRFGLVTLNDKFTERVLENVARAGLSSRLAAVVKLGTAHLPSMDAAFHEAAARDEFAARFTEAARSASAQGADVLIPAGGGRRASLGSIGLHQVDGAPVLNGIIALAKLGETAVRLQKLTGGFISKRGCNAAPTRPGLDSIQAAYGARHSP